jgi:DNA helicase HerA-like ATPase
MFAGLLAEIRAYREGLVIAEQIPARLVPDVIKNTAINFVHRLPAADDRDAVGATMNATPAQDRYLVTLPPGQAAVFTDGMDFPVLVQVKDGTERERASPSTTSDSRTRLPPLGHLRHRMPDPPLHRARHAPRPAGPRRRTLAPVVERPPAQARQQPSTRERLIDRTRRRYRRPAGSSRCR